VWCRSRSPSANTRSEPLDAGPRLTAENAETAERNQPRKTRKHEEHERHEKDRARRTPPLRGGRGPRTVRNATERRVCRSCFCRFVSTARSAGGAGRRATCAPLRAQRALRLDVLFLFRVFRGRSSFRDFRGLVSFVGSGLAVRHAEFFQRPLRTAGPLVDEHVALIPQIGDAHLAREEPARGEIAEAAEEHDGVAQR